jgi:hypothetical protein
MVNAASSEPGKRRPGFGVSDVRSVFVVCLAAGLSIFGMSSSMAGSSNQGTRNYSSYSSSSSYSSGHSAQASSSQDVPANCVRQECGKLWCWNMGNSKR